MSSLIQVEFRRNCITSKAAATSTASTAGRWTNKQFGIYRLTFVLLYFENLFPTEELAKKFSSVRRTLAARGLFTSQRPVYTCIFAAIFGAIFSFW